MDTTAVIMLVVGLLLGLLAGGLTALQVGNTRAAEARTDLERARADAERARAEAATVRAEVSQADAEIAQAHALVAEAVGERSDVQARLVGMTAERDAAVRRAEELAADRESMENRFKVLSNETLEKQGRQADVVAEARLKAMADMLTPVAESLKLMNERINQVERERASATAEMREQINSVLVTSENLRRETNSLVSALRKPQVRGTWGETQLKRVAELAGMVERCDFDLQASTTTEDGVQRPDMRVNLADGKCLFVDSKVPLSAFLDAYEATDDDLRDAHLATFARHVRTHIDQLSSKQYWKLEKNTPEFTILFMPSEAFLQAAHEQMPDLQEYAARRNITLATPSILIPLLRTVAHGWQQAALAESAAEVAELGRELYERLGTMGDHLDRVGKGLTSAVGAYNKAVGSLETRVMVTARKFKDLQVTSRDLPAPHAVEQAPRPITASELTAGMGDEPPALDAGPQPTASERRTRGPLPEQGELVRRQPTLDELLDDETPVVSLDERKRTS